MYQTKFLPFAAVVILSVGVLSHVSGQISSPPKPIIEITELGESSKVIAVEVSPGETNYAVATTYGATYYGQVSSDNTGALFISLNHTQSAPTTISIADSSAVTSVRPQIVTQTSYVTGGSWTRTIFKEGKYVGSIYGPIVSGTLGWSLHELTADIHLDLVIDNGTEAFVGTSGYGSFAGTLDRTSKSAPLKGQLNLVYQPPMKQTRLSSRL